MSTVKSVFTLFVFVFLKMLLLSRSSLSLLLLLLLRLENPPPSQRETEDNPKGSEDDDDDQSLADGRVECAQCRSGPIYPSIIGTARAHAGFPATYDFTVTFSEHPNPKVHIGIREPRKHARQTRRDDFHPHAFAQNLERQLQRQVRLGTGE